MVWSSVEELQYSHFVHICNVSPFEDIQEPNQIEIDRKMWVFYFIDSMPNDTQS